MKVSSQGTAVTHIKQDVELIGEDAAKGQKQVKQVKTNSFTEDQPPGWDEKASKSHLGKN